MAVPLAAMLYTLEYSLRTCEMLRRYFSFCNRSRSHSKWL